MNFLLNMVNYYFVEEEAEYHRKNKQVLKKKKLKKKKEKQKTKVDKIIMKKIDNKDTINHNLMIVDVDLQKCLNCSFTIQKIDDKWFTINTGDNNCGK
ncbi:hypothetical protein C6B38_04470 [Spiroplasma sp. ChiS]|uniref:hypothetical protein n=1 Tax=Spiroplasma sp. ChiS TaxID=2099885 RepID=UPI000CFA59F0|nr:hypothetical protein [Spiroplasma sp. ChiS]PQP78692.1 hypothetical protein C6B38_04470 [Spiroplasma sp. ChiS]